MAPEAILPEIDARRERIRERNGGDSVLRPGETSLELIDGGRRI
jgi:hypothetical protein